MSEEREKLVEEEFEQVCAVADVPEHMPKRVSVGGRGVLICKSDGEFFAVDEICPHKDRSMRFGVIFAGDIICPHHQYHFDLKTGKCKSRCAPIHSYEVRVVDGEIWVRP